jgi:hypothetical protein
VGWKRADQAQQGAGADRLAFRNGMASAGIAAERQPVLLQVRA